MKNRSWLQVFSLLVTIWISLSSAVAEELKFIEIKVEGLEGEVLKNIELALSHPEKLIKNGQVDELMLALFQKEAPQKIRESLQTFGYYFPRIDLALKRGPDSLLLTVSVEPGKPVRIAAIKIEISGPGSSEEAFLESRPAFPLKEGDILRQDLYEEAKTTLLEWAREAGHLDSNFSLHRLLISLEEKKADIELNLETGPRFYFGKITFAPPLTYPENFLTRYLTFRPGMKFSYKQLAETQFNFTHSGHFLKASVDAQKDEASDYHIPVTIRLTPSKTKRLRFGVGYETDQGGGVFINYQDLNFIQMGHELHGEFRLSERLQGVALDYTVPQDGQLGNKIIFDAGFKRELTDTYTTRSMFSKGEYVFSLGKDRWGAGYLKILREDFSVADQEGFSTFLMPGVRLWERRYDDPVKPKRGFRYSLETREGTPLFGTEGYFWQILAEGDSIIPLGKGFSLLLRSKGGTTLQTESLNTLPPSIRFFAGGDQSVRGYAYQSLGTKNAGGQVIGGRHLLVGSLEVEKAVSKVWGLAIFYDVGNAFEDFNDLELKQGAGVGLRFYTPVGPVRLDVARQIGEKDPQFRIHLSIGFGL
jgi:translocation and assembly module TamA